MSHEVRMHPAGPLLRARGAVDFLCLVFLPAQDMVFVNRTSGYPQLCVCVYYVVYVYVYVCMYTMPCYVMSRPGHVVVLARSRCNNIFALPILPQAGHGCRLAHLSSEHFDQSCEAIRCEPLHALLRNEPAWKLIDQLANRCLG